MASSKMKLIDDFRMEDSNTTPLNQYYDISNLQADDIFVIDLDGPDGDYFADHLDAVSLRCRRGGTLQLGKPVTYFDRVHPICVLKLKGIYIDECRSISEKLSVAFLIQKKDIYTIGYCVDHENDQQQKDLRRAENWSLCWDSFVKIENANVLRFSVNYGSSSHERVTDLVRELDKNVGKQTLIKALYYLTHKKDVATENASFHCVCHHVSEPIRLWPAYSRVNWAFHSHSLKPLNILLDLFEEWSKLSEHHRSCVLMDMRFEATEVEKKLNITTFEILHNTLKLVLMEKEERRTERRWGILQKHRKALKHYQSRIDPNKLKKRKPTQKKKWTRSELRIRRQNELQRLIGVGGKEDLWRSLYNMIVEPDMHIVRSVASHTNINIQSTDIKLSYDDYGDEYKFEQEFMLCEPIGIQKDPN